MIYLFTNFTFMGVHVFDILAYSLTLISVCCILAVIYLLYNYIRPKLSVTVNCWFCNQSTKVPYHLSNRWDCPHCEQYNGFTADGDYNDDIIARKGFSNEPVTATAVSPKNGLCKICNINQQLKVQQLAKFTPIDESNYDAEVEHFSQQLEKSYRLCKSCQQYLDGKLLQQSADLGFNDLMFNKERNQIFEETIYTKKHVSHFLRLLSLLLLIIYTCFSLIGAFHQMGCLDIDVSLEKFGYFSNIIKSVISWDFITLLPIAGFVTYLVTFLGGQNYLDNAMLVLWGLLTVLSFTENVYLCTLASSATLFINFKSVRVSSLVFVRKKVSRFSVSSSNISPIINISPPKNSSLASHVVNKSKKSPKIKKCKKDAFSLNKNFDNLSVSTENFFVNGQKHFKNNASTARNIIKPAKFIFTNDGSYSEENPSRSSTPSSGYSSQKNFEKQDDCYKPFNNFQQVQKLTPPYENYDYHHHSPNYAAFPLQFPLQATYCSFSRPGPYGFGLPNQNFDSFISPVSPRLSDASSVINQSMMHSFQSQQKWYAWKNIFYIASVCFNFTSFLILALSYWSGALFAVSK